MQDCYSSKVEKVAVYPGSFDPITWGHIDILKRSLCIFEKVIIAVNNTSSKKFLFSFDERVKMIKEVLNKEKINSRVEIKELKGLLVDFLKTNNVRVVIRGLRVVSDFEYEFRMAWANKKLWKDIEMIYFFSSEKYTFLASTIVKEVANLGGDLSCFVPKYIEKYIKEKFKK